MDVQDIQYKINEFLQKANYQVNLAWQKTQGYFRSLDQWEWVGWGGEALGLVLVIISIFLF